MSDGSGKSRSTKIKEQASRLYEDRDLTSSLCLIFNGIASMIAILFLVFYIIGYTVPLLWLGIAGCVCMVLANTTDIIPFWLGALKKKLKRE